MAAIRRCSRPFPATSSSWQLACALAFRRMARGAGPPSTIRYRPRNAPTGSGDRAVRAYRAARRGAGRAAVPRPTLRAAARWGAEAGMTLGPVPAGSSGKCSARPAGFPRAEPRERRFAPCGQRARRRVGRVRGASPGSSRAGEGPAAGSSPGGTGPRTRSPPRGRRGTGPRSPCGRRRERGRPAPRSSCGRSRTVRRPRSRARAGEGAVCRTWFQPMCGTLSRPPVAGSRGGEAGDPALKRREPPRSPVLLALLHQRLEADADAEERLLPDRVAHARLEAMVGEPGHAVPDRALAGEDDPVRRRDPLRVRGDDHFDSFAADVANRLLDGTQVPHSEIDDRDLLHHRAPAPEHDAPEHDGRPSVPSSGRPRPFRPPAGKIIRPRTSPSAAADARAPGNRTRPPEPTGPVPPPGPAGTARSGIPGRGTSGVRGWGGAVPTSPGE